VQKTGGMGIVHIGLTTSPVKASSISEKQQNPLLFIDLNNFAAYPTLTVGYLIRP